MGSKKTTQKTQETATTTPNMPGYATPAIQNYFTGAGNLFANPSAAQTPANDLQNSAFSQAQGLPSASSTFAPAVGAMQNAMGLLGGVSPATLTTATAPTGFAPAQVGTQTATTGQASAPTAFGPAQATTQTAGVGQAGFMGSALPEQYNVAQAQTAAYPGLLQAQIGNLPTASQVDTGALEGLNAAGYGGASSLTNLNAFLNPYTDQVVNTSMADMADMQGADRAAYARRGAMNGAFGGSRYGLGETNLMSQQERARASLGANLRMQAFNNALSASGEDANRFNSAGIASMQSANELASNKAQMGMQAALADAAAQNEFGLAGFNAGNQMSMFNAGEGNDALASIFAATNDNNMFNAGQTNAANSQFYSTAADNNQFNAGQANQAAQFNTGQANQAGQFNAAQANQGSQFNAGQANDINSLIYGTQAGLNQFNTAQANQGSQFNAGQANQANQFNAGQANDINSMLYGTQAGMNQFNAGQANQNSQYNSGLNLNTAQAAGNMASAYGGLLGDQAGLNMDQINQLASLGQQQWGVDVYNNPLSQYTALGGLLNPNGVLNLATGQTVNSNGTSVSKESGGLLGQILGAAAQVGSAAMMASERHVKRDIEIIDREPDGLGIYHYNYIWDDEGEPVRQGVMVDEVERLRPWALGPVVDGIRTVNYGAL